MAISGFEHSSGPESSWGLDLAKPQLPPRGLLQAGSGHVHPASGRFPARGHYWYYPRREASPTGSLPLCLSCSLWRPPQSQSLTGTSGRQFPVSSGQQGLRTHVPSLPARPPQPTQAVATLLAQREAASQPQSRGVEARLASGSQQVFSLPCASVSSPEKWS